MSNQRYTPEFKDEAARQIVDRGYSVADVSERLGVSAHSLYKWVKAIKPDKTEEQAAALIEAKSEVLKLLDLSASDWQISFCRRCGSPVPGINDEARTFVPAGLITEGGQELRVAHHIWVDSRATWDKIGDYGQRHSKAFEG